MTNEKLAQHISNELWLQKSKVVEVLASYEETPTPVKHPIERVNAKYPNGWYCEVFGEVREDSEKANQEISQSEWEYYGWFSYEDYGFIFIGFNDGNDDDDIDLFNVTFITKSEYLAITRGVTETPQRDYTGVRFSGKPIGVNDGIIEKSENGKYNLYPHGLNYTQKDVEDLFKKGDLIELPQEEEQQYIKNEDVERQIDAVFNGVAKHKREHIQDAIDSLTFKPTIHASKPSNIEERVKALEEKVSYLTELHQDTVCIEPTKQNLPIDTPTIDWKEIFER